MNLTEFLAELRKTRNGWTANVGTNRAIRQVAQGYVQCPITAVCESVTKTLWTLRNYHTAGDRLGLNAKLAERIALAADFDGPSERWMRSRLLKAVGR